MTARATSMVKVAYFFIVVDTLIAIWRYCVEDKPHTIMFLAGAMMWIVCVLIWTKNVKDEEEGND